MMGYVSARRRADEFAAAIDGTKSSSAAQDTRAFLAIVQQLRNLEQPCPRADFSADLRTRLMVAAPTALALADPDRDRRVVTLTPFDPRTARRRRVVSATAAACIVVGSGVGVAAASQSALPGDTLYPFKRGIEQFQVSTAGSASDRGGQYLDNAGIRLTEIETLALTRPDDRATPTLIDKTLEDFTDAADAGSDELIDAYSTEDSSTSIVELRQFTGESADRLDDLLRSLPVALRDDLLTAADDLTKVDAAARQLCPDCSSLPPLQLSAQMMAVRDDVESLGTSQVQKPAVSTSPTSGETPAPRPSTETPAQTPRAQSPTTISAPALPSGSSNPSPSTTGPTQPQPTSAPGVTSAVPPLPQSDDSVDTSAPSVPLPSELVVNAPTVPLVSDATGGSSLLP